MDYFSLAVVVLSAISVILLVILLLRPVRIDAAAMGTYVSKVEDGVRSMQEQVRDEFKDSRAESRQMEKAARDELRDMQRDFAKDLGKRIGELTKSSEDRINAIQTSVVEQLKELRRENSKKLEAMQEVVDTKLEETLKTRFKNSFELVSDQLNKVHEGLGEMRELASDVGDLKRVFANIKSRGTWGEVQLGSLLEDVLTPEQYERNVAVKEGQERVEYAVRLPNQDSEEDLLLLPIDSKFPVEDFQRLQSARESGDVSASNDAIKGLISGVKHCADKISKKYINPPKTTDFAILFLPAEGLFAEVMGIPGLHDEVMRNYKVTITGPTTLWAVLSSLRMGFRTLAIQKRSSEVWEVLGAVKTEFENYGKVLSQVQKKLTDASTTIDVEVQRRTRAIQRKLREVEQLPERKAQEVLSLTEGAFEAKPQDED